MRPRFGLKYHGIVSRECDMRDEDMAYSGNKAHPRIRGSCKSAIGGDINTPRHFRIIYL